MRDREVHPPFRREPESAAGSDDERVEHDSRLSFERDTHELKKSRAVNARRRGDGDGALMSSATEQDQERDKGKPLSQFNLRTFTVTVVKSLIQSASVRCAR